MTTRLFTVERMEVASKKSFEETAAAFEKRVPQADIDVFTRLIAVRGSRALCEAGAETPHPDRRLMVTCTRAGLRYAPEYDDRHRTNRKQGRTTLR